MRFINNPQKIRIERREWYEYLKNDISPMFRPSFNGSNVARAIAGMENSPSAIRYFAKNSHTLDEYHYWFLLGCCWVQYTGWTELSLWKDLFRSSRPHREACLMKPTERRIFKHILPRSVRCYRAHRPNETDYISYTLDLDTANRFARERNVDSICEYEINKKNIIALFLRRHEYEILCLDRDKAHLISIMTT